MKPNQSQRAVLLWAAFSIPVIWAALVAAHVYRKGQNLLVLLSAFMKQIEKPFSIHWSEHTPIFLCFFVLAYIFAITLYQEDQKKRRPGIEHGSAAWGLAAQLCARYQNKKQKDQNIILTKHVRMGLDGRRHRRNLNVLVCGGSGSGKTRFYCLPNLMQASMSYIVADPKGEMLRMTGDLLRSKGYDVKVFNLVNAKESDHYNPFAYLHGDLDVIKLVSNLIKNTTPKKSNINDPFWEKSEIALDTALILYLLHEAPPEEQNFETLMYMIENGTAKEDDEEYRSPLDLLFDALEEQQPNHIALKQYKIFKQASGKTAKSILISAAVRLAAFNLPAISSITNNDDLDLSTLGESRRAIFAVIPDNDSSFNYLVGMLYTQAFQSLYYQADNVHGGRLPVPVSIIMDEFANVALPDDFEHILSTCRSREIFLNIVIQNMAQLKALFKDTWENITGNCDTFLYLGGNEQSTHEYISKLLGKETIDTHTYGLTRGRSGSSSKNYQQVGRELLMPDEVRLLDNDYALLFIRGEKPVLDRKYDIKRHPNYKFTAEGGKKKRVVTLENNDIISNDLHFSITDLTQIEILEPEEIFYEKESESTSN